MTNRETAPDRFRVWVDDCEADTVCARRPGSAGPVNPRCGVFADYAVVVGSDAYADVCSPCLADTVSDALIHSATRHHGYRR